jgi:hypothetical protein
MDQPPSRDDTNVSTTQSSQRAATAQEGTMSKIYDALQHLEAQRKAATETDETPNVGANPLDLQERPAHSPSSAPRSPMSQNLLEQTAAVTRFGAELHRRMGEVGLKGVEGIFALADQLQRALGMVSHPELDTAEADLDRVADRIRAMKDDLRKLKGVKAEVEGFTAFTNR